MRMDKRDISARFAEELNKLGQFAARIVPALRRVYLFAAAQNGEKPAYFACPQEENWPEQVCDTLCAVALSAGAASAAEAPFFVQQLQLADGVSIGAVAFERRAGAWPPAERALLASLTALFAYALHANRARLDAALQNGVWNHMMDSTHACIYVTDTKTDEILFMNRSMKQTYGLESPEGQICWKVLQRDRQERCDFCPVQQLLQDRDVPAYVWEEKNPLTGRIYENYDSLMRWSDGRLVHFQHSTDVTEARRLYKAAMTDELTGAYSRLAGKEELSRLLDAYTAEDQPLSVCMLDVNGLKTVNDLHGHAAGDALLLQVAECVRAALKGREYLMRLSGDEFVAVLPGVRQSEAEARMQAALAGFEQKRPGLFTEKSAFCYGVVEVRERAPLRDVLARADERMYQQKRTLHIHRAEAQLRSPNHTDATAPFSYDANRLYDALIQCTDSYVYVCNMKTGVFRYPPAMVSEFGLPGEIVPNAAAIWGAKVHPHDRRIFLESNQDITDGRTDIHCIEYRAQNVRGEWVWLRCRGHLERDENGEPILFAGFITNLGKKNKIDPLTGLFNKFELEENVQRLLSPEASRPLTFMMLGIDDLKRVNALYDRVFGDEVIRLTAQRLQSLLPSDAAVYRLDGDEFAILMRGASRTAAEQLFSHIREAFSGQQTFDGKKFHCTLSCGCAFAPDDGESYVALSRSAAYALEYAKRRGKNRLERYTAEIVGKRRRTLELTELLRERIELGFQGFALHFQPVFDKDRSLVGAEALARWRCDPYGEISPGEFIPLLEKSGLILPAGRWIFEEALRTCARWNAHMPTFEMSVNLSYLQLEDDGFYRFMLDTVRKADVEPGNIILELTESYLAENMPHIAERLEGLRGYGLRIAMDDFGTGYSSLGLLKQAPIDIAKIDRSFVKGIRSSTFDSAFLRLVVELCNVLGIDTCLEGVETPEELQAVQAMPLSYLQGFLLGRPLSADAFERQYISSIRG